MKANHNTESRAPSRLKLLPIFQRYKLKANHNSGGWLSPLNFVVANISKIQIESKSQRGLSPIFATVCCLSLSQRYELKLITIHERIKKQK